MGGQGFFGQMNDYDLEVQSTFIHQGRYGDVMHFLLQPTLHSIGQHPWPILTIQTIQD